MSLKIRIGEKHKCNIFLFLYSNPRCMNHFVSVREIEENISQDMRLPLSPKSKKKQKKEISMYKENQNKLINIVDDGDIIHIFITAPSKKKEKVENALKSSFRELSKIYGGSIIKELDYDDEQFYFTLDTFDEYDDFKHIFYKEYCDFDLSKKESEDRYNEDRF